MNLSPSPAATPPLAPLFELDRATVVRGATRVLHDLSLTIPLGQHTAILGPNGCGKSTFIKLINRELYPLAREGEAPVKVFGLRRWNVSQLRNRLGVVTSDLTRDLQQMPQLRVEDAVVTGAPIWATLYGPILIYALIQMSIHGVVAQVRFTTHIPRCKRGFAVVKHLLERLLPMNQISLSGPKTLWIADRFVI